MAGRIEGKVAIITGGASGMGRDTALRFLREGAQVVIADMNEGTGKDTLELAAAEGFDQDIRFIRTDVSQESDIEAMVRHATDEFGRLDCIFNNAGLGGAMGKATEIEVDDWDFTFGVLVRGVFLGIKHAARVMQAQGEGGSIINTASVAGMTGGCGPVAYSASKAAVMNLTRTTSAELAEHHIRVNCICPGAILTPLLHRGHPDLMADRLSKAQPWPETGLGEHIAGAALFLASEDARFVTGVSLPVDGGLTGLGVNIRRSINPEEAAASPLAGVTGVDHGNTGLGMTVRKAGS
ncbi:MAG: glucose 1-dehydrogenase [Myxococcota bacterium]